VANVAGTHVINLCGQLSLAQSASIVGQSARVFTHDTGLMHIAAALRKPIVSIWGSTVPAFGMYPFYPDGLDLNTTLEVKDLSCRPCSKIGYDKCPKGHFRCMVGQDFGLMRNT
jgi:ADP-heptose:LPS heptosyltransferase